ncbi:MAG: hypothetical protein J0G30_07325 [Actinomycetales bacterium]|nr:hypothetical protein [Actinomycetales bacterium]
MAERRTTKKVVKVEVDREAVAEEAKASGSEWKPTAEAKSSATGLRVGAWVFWALALVGEGLAIYWLVWLEPFKPTAVAPWYLDSSIALYVLIGMLVGIGLLAVAGSQLWKKANRLDPAKRSEPFRFFVQNQLGAIVTMVAFIPLIVLIFLNKDMDGKQKGIAGAVGIGVLVIATILGISWNPPAVEDHPVDEAQVAEYTTIVEELTGADTVTWTASGTVYHLCTDASAVNRSSADNAIYTGTVEAAHADGKVGLTKEVTEELGQCSLPEPANLDEIEAQVDELRAEAEAVPAS